MIDTFASSAPAVGLRSTLEAACVEADCSAGDLTVLAPQNDPFRVDTASRHRDGKWLAVQARNLGLGDRIIHLRGLHYMLVSGEVSKPNGLPYTNTDASWNWLVGDAAKAARWLGYLPFEQIKDARSSEPVIRPFERAGEPVPYLSVGVDVEIPDVDELKPQIYVDGFASAQPYKLVLFGEKTSLEDVLTPIAEEHEADLYLPAGEISDSYLHTMAKVGADDGRPVVVFTITDSDPAGWQMPISIGRKLQAFKALMYPQFEFQVHRVALLPDHVREYRLPSTPLKDTERRADRWTAAMGVEQTEVDALAALQPHLLDGIVRDAMVPYFDATLARRVYAAEREWRVQAQALLEKQLDDDELDRIRAEAAGKLDQLQVEIDAINEALRIDIAEVDLPPIIVPEADVAGDYGLPLIDSAWPWVDQTRRLKMAKNY